jgi:hypothetical protein
MAEFYRPGSILIFEHPTGIESVTVMPLRGVDTFFLSSSATIPSDLFFGGVYKNVNPVQIGVHVVGRSNG